MARSPRPGLGTLIVSELAPTPKDRYIESILPQLIAATVAFAVFFGAVGTTFLNSFAVPVDDFASWHLLVGAGLGLVSSVIMIVFVIIMKLIQTVAAKLTNPYVRGTVGGALVGLIAFALPLTIGAGNDQLTTVIDESASISIWLLVAVLVGKMLAMAISLATGFIGGNVLADAVRRRHRRRRRAPDVSRHPVRDRRRLHAGGRAQEQPSRHRSDSPSSRCWPSDSAR